jgi:hypothetical protein
LAHEALRVELVVVVERDERYWEALLRKHIE